MGIKGDEAKKSGEEQQRGNAEGGTAKISPGTERRARQREALRPTPRSMWTAPQSFIPPPNPADQPTDRQAQAFSRRVTRSNVIGGPVPSHVQRYMNLGAGVLAIGATSYMVLLHDFGPREHVFMPIRRFFSLEQFNPMTLSAEEQEWARKKKPAPKADDKMV